MVKFFKNMLLYLRFRNAVSRCEELNAQPHEGGEYIVANICGQPAIINRQGFRGLRTKGYFRHDLKWAEVCEKQITRRTLKQWLNAN